MPSEELGHDDRHRLESAKKAIGIGMNPNPSVDQREWLRDRMEEISGTRDLKEANRRAEMLHQWRNENDAW